MAGTQQPAATLSEPTQGPKAADISIAVLYPGGRADKLLRPLSATDMTVNVEPDDAYAHDIVIADNADRDLGKEVIRNQFTDSKLVYRLRGDVYHELDLWGMHWSKHLAATKLVLPNVDGVIAVSDRLAQKYARKSGIASCYNAGLAKDPDNWPDRDHQRQTIQAVTLTNMNYWKKVAPIPEWASVVNSVLDDVGGHWTVCGKGEHADDVAESLEGYQHVSYGGFVDAKDQLERSNLMLHPSLLDGQPNSVLEGMASKLPVITNDFAAFTEFDGPVDIARTKNELRSLLQGYAVPATRQDAGARCLEYIRHNHSEAAIGQQYTDACKQLLA